VPGTRSVYYERNQGGLYLDIIPDRDALARYGLTVGDVERVIEASIGGTPISTTIEGRNRFSINVRYPQSLRDNLEQLKRVLVPVRSGGGASGAGMGVPGMPPGAVSGMGAPAAGAAATPGGGRTFVPLGQLAEIKIVGGPPMVRDEGGMLVGYVYVDIDQGKRDIGGYVAEAKEVVRKATRAHELHLPAGTFLKWTGQYELLEVMATRMKIVIPVTLMIIVVLLFLHFRNFVEVLIVLLSIPFALVGSIWLMWLLDYRLSTAVYVGIIALVGLAAQTGIVMIVYIDNAYERRRQAGKVRDLNDIIWAHLEGTVMRVRPKLMTVGTMLFGLIPLLWATGSGADVMKRIAAPMVGGLLTSAFLTLEIIPVIYTYWRQEQVLWERLAPLDPRLLTRLKAFAYAQGAVWAVASAALVSSIYVAWPAAVLTSLLGVCGSAVLALFVAYLATRPAGRRLVWPRPGAAVSR